MRAFVAPRSCKRGVYKSGHPGRHQLACVCSLCRAEGANFQKQSDASRTQTCQPFLMRTRPHGRMTPVSNRGRHRTRTTSLVERRSYVEGNISATKPPQSLPNDPIVWQFQSLNRDRNRIGEVQYAAVTVKAPIAGGSRLSLRILHIVQGSRTRRGCAT